MLAGPDPSGSEVTTSSSAPLHPTTEQPHAETREDVVETPHAKEETNDVVHEADASDGKPSDVTPARAKLFEDDGTLDLLSVACVHPTLIACLTKLTGSYINAFNQTATKFNAFMNDVSQTPREQYTKEQVVSLHTLQKECRHLAADLNRDVVMLDCIDLDASDPAWGSRTSIRQSRRELIQIFERLCSRLDEMLARLPMDDVQPHKKAKTHASGATFQSRWGGERPPPSSSSQHVGVVACSGPVRASETQHVKDDAACPNAEELQASAADKRRLDPDSDGGSEDDDTRRQRRRRRKRPVIDWTVKASEKIKLFKQHTSKGGCVTTLYDNPVNRETLLVMLAKCEPYLEDTQPDPIQMKIAIETFIAGLETAYNYLNQLRVNKAQMKLLYESATVLDHLEGPEELLPEIRSLQGLLKTFGMF